MTEHEACLARIDVLERELFPEWFAQIRSLPKPPRKPPSEARMIPGRDLRETESDYTRRRMREIPGEYAEALIRLSWQQDPKNGGLVPSEREAITMNLPMSAVAVRPGAMWPVEAHNEIAPFVLLKNQLDKKRIILP